MNKKEYYKKYYQKNKEKLKAYSSAYRLAHKEKIKEKNKIYKAKNKDKYKQYEEKRNIKILCICGSIVKKKYISTHKKTKKHLNYVKHVLNVSYE